MATAGTFNFSDKKMAPRFKAFELIPRGIYRAVLKSKGVASIQRVQEPGKAARVAIRFALPDVTTDQGTPRFLFHDFHLGLKPGKNGFTMPQRPEGLQGFLVATGEDSPNFKVILQEDVDNGKFEQLSAKEVKAWLEEMDGREVYIEVDVEPKRGQYGPKNRIQAFGASESDLSDDNETDDNEESTDDETDTSEADSEQTDESEDEVDEEAEEPPANKKKLAPPKNGVKKNGKK